MVLNDLPWKWTKIIQSFLRLHPSTSFWTLLLTMMATPFLIIGDWNAKVGSQETPEVTGKFGLGMWNEEGQRLIVLPRECAGHSKHPLPTTQEKTLHVDITRWATLKSDWLYSLQPKMEKLYTVSKNKTGSWQIMNSLLPNSDWSWRKWKTTRPFRYDLNQIPKIIQWKWEIDLRD